MKNQWAKKLLFCALIIVCPILVQAVQVDYKTVAMTGKMVSIPERFQIYSGIRSLEYLSNLFVNPHPAGIIQLPRIAVADGVSNVVIELKLSNDAAFAPNFAVKAAKLVSISHPVSDKWIVTVIPEKGSWRPLLLIMNGNVVIEVPLVVTPPMPQDIIPDEKFFLVKGSDGIPGLISKDLNGDGKADYIDDYIFMANYLLRKSSVYTSDEPTKTETASQLPVSPVKQNPGAGPGIDPNSGAGLKPVLDAERHNPASRNERARKMKEQLK